MTGRRILYTLLLLGTFIFFIAYQKWLAWFLFITLALLPVFSVLVSLPAMLTARLRISGPDRAEQGQGLDLELTCRSRWPVPPLRCKLLVEQPLTGEKRKIREGDLLPTEHCGTLMISVQKAKIYDYLGLFSLPLRHKQSVKIQVWPMPVVITDLPPLSKCQAQVWRPKPGGGFGENHELRLYRPGDNIQQIHWKLSAKTGSLILREPMEPVRGKVLARMDLNGTPQELDEKLGKLLWLGQKLLAEDIHFQLQCLTGMGAEHWDVSSDASLEAALDDLLGRTPAVGSLRDRPQSAVWQYHIGGGGHED